MKTCPPAEQRARPRSVLIPNGEHLQNLFDRQQASCYATSLPPRTRRSMCAAHLLRGESKCSFIVHGKPVRLPHSSGFSFCRPLPPRRNRNEQEFGCGGQLSWALIVLFGAPRSRPRGLNWPAAGRRRPPSSDSFKEPSRHPVGDRQRWRRHRERRARPVPPPFSWSRSFKRMSDHRVGTSTAGLGRS